jgi:hypothetical protein
MYDSTADPVKNSQQVSQPNPIHHPSSIYEATVVAWPFLSGTATAGAESLAIWFSGEPNQESSNLLSPPSRSPNAWCEWIRKAQSWKCVNNDNGDGGVCSKVSPCLLVPFRPNQPCSLSFTWSFFAGCSEKIPPNRDDEKRRQRESGPWAKSPVSGVRLKEEGEGLGEKSTWRWGDLLSYTLDIPTMSGFGVKELKFKRQVPCLSRELLLRLSDSTWVDGDAGQLWTGGPQKLSWSGRRASCPVRWDCHCGSWAGQRVRQPWMKGVMAWWRESSVEQEHMTLDTCFFSSRERA